MVSSLLRENNLFAEHESVLAWPTQTYRAALAQTTDLSQGALAASRVLPVAVRALQAACELDAAVAAVGAQFLQEVPPAAPPAHDWGRGTRRTWGPDGTHKIQRSERFTVHKIYSDQRAGTVHTTYSGKRGLTVHTKYSGQRGQFGTHKIQRSEGLTVQKFTAVRRPVLYTEVRGDSRYTQNTTARGAVRYKKNTAVRGAIRYK